MPKKRKYTYEVVSSLLSKEGYTLLSLDYEGDTSRMEVKCKKGHTYVTYKNNFISRGNRCLQCSGSRKYTLEEIKSKVEDEGYTLLSKEYKKASQKIKLKCPKGHLYSVSWVKFNLRGDRCTKCSGTAKLTEEDAIDRFKEAGLTYIDKEFNYAVEPVKFRCQEGHEHKMSLHNLKKGQGCGVCYKNSSEPKVEKELSRLFSETGVFFIKNDRVEIAPYELDFYFPNEKVAVEYCGLYWHSETSGKSRRYHYDKMMLCRDKGIRLITVFEDEWIDRPNVVFSRITNSLGKSKRKVFARKCTVKKICSKEGRRFLTDYHLQSSGRANFYIGLFLNEELLGVMSGGSLTRSHVSNNIPTMELKRMAFLPNLNVVGGASKMFKLFEQICKDKGIYRIRSYCDMRYGNPFSSVYESLGFSLIFETKYTPHYIRHQKRYRNFSLRKTPEERLTGKTEYELRLEQGYHRIWDCGHRTYQKEL